MTGKFMAGADIVAGEWMIVDPQTGMMVPSFEAVAAPRRAFAAVQHCELVTYHAPAPVIVEHHHQRPVFLQNRLYGRILYGPSLWVCSNCHDSIHAWLYWLLRERAEPPQIGYAARREAEHTHVWYEAEKARLA